MESDFFRNRLTHSLEVAQIAATITRRLNSEYLREAPQEIDVDLVEFAALAHDLGHPPFGHTGEEALDELMRGQGGFEGNAQTLRILAKLEKKLDDPDQQVVGGAIPFYQGHKEISAGLNLCSRSLASILKYDHLIPRRRKKAEPVEKGYYGLERNVVQRIRRDVIQGADRPLKVVECQIMDLADDIAYSTYDLEDAFKGGLLTPLDLVFAENAIVESVAQRVAKELGRPFAALDAQRILDELFSDFIALQEPPPVEGAGEWFRQEIGRAYATAKTVVRSGFHRTALTSTFVNRFIHAVRLEVDEEVPPLSRVVMDPEIRCQVSVLKHLAYVLLIDSHRLKLVEHRGKKVVREIFEALSTRTGAALLPPDFSARYRDAPTEAARKRVSCDYIAGMTDRYALDFYARLRSEDFHSIFRLL